MKKIEEPIVKVMNLKQMDVIATSGGVEANTATIRHNDITSDFWK